MKKGNASWRPASSLVIRNQDPNYVYSFRDRHDSDRLARLREEGWEFVKADHERNGGLDSDGLTSTTEYRELVAMRMRKDTREARFQYYQEQTDKQTINLKKRLQKEMSDEGAARVHGSITIIE